MRDDEVLCREYLEGNEDGLDELIERDGTRLTSYIHRYIHDIDGAEDLTIDVFAYLSVKKSSIRQRSFKAYFDKSAWTDTKNDGTGRSAFVRAEENGLSVGFLLPMQAFHIAIDLFLTGRQ